jgi:hypothetical protein
MNKFVAIANIEPVLDLKVLLPTTTLWNRLEGRPRTHDFDRALKAEVRDPLWMLTRQWQMGEFEGDDAGSPIEAKIHFTTTRLTKYRAGGSPEPAGGHPAQPFETEVPLEAKVEQRPFPMEAGAHPLSLDLRVLLGRRWLKLVAPLEAAEPGLRDQFVAKFAIPLPDPALPASAAICAHQDAFQAVSALAGRAMDGWLLYRQLTGQPPKHAHDGITLADPASEGAIAAAEAAFVQWYDGLFYQPLETVDDAWRPERLEYAFDCSAPRAGAEMVLTAEEYHHGHLDWYNLDIDASQAALPPAAGAPLPGDVEGKETLAFLPVPITFDGMPNTRWWTFEEGRTNFGDIDPDTTDINKLLLMEFALIYANDWFLLPITVPAGTISSIAGLAVTNVFGERTWVEASGRGADQDWQRWAMFALNVKGSDDVPADTSLLVLPTVSKIQESEPFESVELVRDEMANMVWGVETAIPLASGETRSGRSLAFETRAFHARLAPPAPAAGLPENEAAIRYQLMTSVPENWIPFIPVHIPGDNREIQLRRASMPRIIDNGPVPPDAVKPRTTLLRHGLDAPVPARYNLHEEEVPRAGVQVHQSFQRARWYDGRTFVWFGARKQAGRGEKSSGLQFDQVKPKPAA